MERYRYASYAARQLPRPQAKPGHKGRASIVAAVLLGSAIVGVWLVTRHFDQRGAVAERASLHATTAVKRASSAQVTAKPSICTQNSQPETVYISISQRHMWACTLTTQSYDSPVVTGMENIAADLTPIGTYHIYAKQTNIYLDGSDSTGSWHDYVYYWMPFLSNQYGIYGFHDATWRPADAFGHIDPYSSSASHGCIELPLATSKWLYNWAAVGTPVVISN